MKKFNFLLFLILIAINIKTYSQEYSWAKTFGSTGVDISYFSTTDNDGNTYMTGYFCGSVDFDGTGNFTGTTSADDDKDIFIIKYNTIGEVLWLKTMGGTDVDKGASIAIDNENNIYITGDFKSEDVNFGGTATDIDAQGEEDIFLLKLDANGNFIWFKHYGAAAKDAGISLCFDNSNNLLLTGFFARTVQFNPDNEADTLKSAGYIDALVLKLNTNGDYIWAKSFAGAEYVKGLYITADNNNSVYVTGYYYGTADFNPSPVVAENVYHTSNGERDFYVTKLDENGNYVWSGSIGGIEDDRAISITVDNSNNLYFTGFFAEDADFDMGDGTETLTSNGESDIFIFKIDDAGNLIWVKQIGGTGADFANEIKLDRNSNLLITGSFSSTVDFNPNSGTENFTAHGSNSDIYLLKLDFEGNYIWNVTTGDYGSDEPYALSLDNSENIYVSGSFSGSVDFDFGVNEDIISSNGARDVFLTKIHDNTVSLNDIFNKNLINIYPNPTNLSITINSKNDIIETIIISDITGKIVKQISVNKNQILIDLSKETKGVYFVEIQTNNDTVTSKIIKQ